MEAPAPPRPPPPPPPRSPRVFVILFKNRQKKGGLLALQCGVADPDPEPDPKDPVLRIRIYYYADPDPGSKKCPYGSGS